MGPAGPACCGRRCSRHRRPPLGFRTAEGVACTAPGRRAAAPSRCGSPLYPLPVSSAVAPAACGRAGLDGRAHRAAMPKCLRDLAAVPQPELACAPVCPLARPGAWLSRRAGKMFNDPVTAVLAPTARALPADHLDTVDVPRQTSCMSIDTRDQRRMTLRRRSAHHLLEKLCAPDCT